MNQLHVTQPASQPTTQWASWLWSIDEGRGLARWRGRGDSTWRRRRNRAHVSVSILHVTNRHTQRMTRRTRLYSELTECRLQHARLLTSTHKHAHIRLTDLCPGQPGWAGTRKVKLVWILLKQETVASAVHMQVCTWLQTDNHASTPPLSFLQAGCPSCHPTNSVKALKTIQTIYCHYRFKKQTLYLAATFQSRLVRTE